MFSAILLYSDIVMQINYYYYYYYMSVSLSGRFQT